MPAILLHLLPASLYALLGVHFWHTRWIAPTSAPRQGLQPKERVLMLVALVAHGFALNSTFFSAEGIHFGFSLALSLMLWLAILFYWIESLYARLEGLQTLGMPVAAVCSLLPAFFPGGAKLVGYMDIENLGNLINDEWGTVQQIGFPYTSNNVTATRTGDQYYTYTGFTERSPSTFGTNSVWQIKVGVRYSF